MEQRSTQNKTSNIYFTLNSDKSVTIAQSSSTSYYYDLIPVTEGHDYYICITQRPNNINSRLYMISIAESAISLNATVLDKFSSYYYAGYFEDIYTKPLFQPAFYFHANHTGYLWIYSGSTALNYNFDDLSEYNTHSPEKYWTILFGRPYINPTSPNSLNQTVNFLFKGYPTTYNSQSYGDSVPYTGLYYWTTSFSEPTVGMIRQSTGNAISITQRYMRSPYYYYTYYPARMLIAEEWNSTNYRYLFMNMSMCYIKGTYRLRQTPSNISFNYGIRETYIPVNCDIVYNDTNHIAKGLMLGTFGSWDIFPYLFRYMQTNNSPETLLSYASETAYPTKPHNDFTIDFGSVEQEIPLAWYLYLMEMLEPAYSNQYTVKSVGGDTLFESEPAYPAIKSVTLSNVGNQVYFDVTGVNDVVYNFTYSHTPVAGRTFMGYAYSASATVPDIPLGTTTVTINENKTFYEVWDIYNPPARTFGVNLYEYSGEAYRVDKSSMLTSVGTIEGALRKECSILRPTLLVQFADNVTPTCNYLYIAKFNRYYYITNITSIRQRLWQLDCEVDVLMSYKTGILGLNAYIARQENDYNDELIDNQLPCEKQSEIMVFDPSEGYDTGTFNNQLEDGAHNFVLTVVGA